MLPILGRDFTNEEYRTSAPTVVLLGEDYWRRTYQGRRDIIGSSLSYVGGVATIVGVAPLALSSAATIFRPLQPRDANATGIERVSVMARLQPAVTLDAGQAALSGSTNVQDTLNLQAPFEELFFANRLSGRLILSASILLLLMSCLCVGGLLLNRTLRMLPSLGIHAALGATPRQIVTSVLISNTAVSLLGGVLGIAVAVAGADAIGQMIPLAIAPGRILTIDRSIVGVLVPGALIASITAAASSVPAIANVRSLRLFRDAIASRVTVRLALFRRVLVGAESAIATVLVALACVTSLSLWRLENVDLGIDPAGYSLARVQPTAAVQSFYPRLVSELRAVGWIRSVGAVDHAPFSGSSERIDSSAVVPESGVALRPPPQGWEIRRVIPGFFESVHAILDQGRFPGDEDLDRSANVVLNKAAEEALFGQSPRPAVGRTVFVKGMPLTVIGVIEDIRQTGPKNLSNPEVYFAESANQMTLTIHPARSAGDVARKLRTAAMAMHTRFKLLPIVSGTESSERYYEASRKRTGVFAVFALSALTLSCLGFFATAAYDVFLRRPQLAIRSALGASQVRLVAENMYGTAVPVLIGIVVGMCGFRVSGVIVQDVMFATAPDDVFAGAVAGLLAALAGILATWLPSRKIPPSTVLNEHHG